LCDLVSAIGLKLALILDSGFGWMRTKLRRKGDDPHAHETSGRPPTNRVIENNIFAGSVSSDAIALRLCGRRGEVEVEEVVPRLG
jgi:hypothetical protein